MKFIALLLALAIERWSTHLFRLGEIRWLDWYFDLGLGVVRRVPGWPGTMAALFVVMVPVLPVAWVAFEFRDVLWGALYICFAVLVLLFSLGPRDLSTEVDDFVAATREGDDERALRVARELLETDPPQDTSRRSLAIEEAIFVQSNNRSFAVVLWFVVLGPAGAWLFRVTDLMRRRAFFEAGRAREKGEDCPANVTAVQRLHGVLAWLPSRIVALTFALAGSFEPAVADWRDYYRNCSDHFFEVNEEVVACAGLGALGPPPPQGDDDVIVSAQAALKLVHRSQMIWLVAIAVLTAIGASI
ncbi:MAG: regulatory signaling modulator protein AmpE [Gammaproteobacteria bacterium]